MPRRAGEHNRGGGSNATGQRACAGCGSRPDQPSAIPVVVGPDPIENRGEGNLSDVEGVQAGGARAGDVVVRVVSDVERPASVHAEALQRQRENPRIGLGGAGVGRQRHGVQERRQPERLEQGPQSMVEVGHHPGAKAAAPQALEQGAGAAASSPGGRSAVVVEEPVEEGFEGEEVAGAGGHECPPDERSPPGALERRALGGIGIRKHHRRHRPVRRGERAPADAMRRQVDADFPRRARVGLADRLAQLDQRADGIEQDGAQGEPVRQRARSRRPCCFRRQSNRSIRSWPKKGSPSNTMVGTPQWPAASRSR